MTLDRHPGHREPPRLLVTGAGGMVGTAFRHEARARGLEVTGLAREELDVTDADAVDRVIRTWMSERSPPSWVVHCAAYTAVDRAESEPEKARVVNVEGAGNVARATAAAGARVVYLSTDYVFDGRAREPYATDAVPSPLSVYGRTKLEGEGSVGRAHPSALIVRSGWLYGEGGRGFVKSMLERATRGDQLRIVDDQVGGPTWTGTLVETVLDLMEGAMPNARSGVYHVAARGSTSWFGLASEAMRLKGVDVRMEPVSSAEFAAAARRPSYSVLDVRATEAALGRRLPEWDEVLADVLSGGEIESDERVG